MVYKLRFPIEGVFAWEDKCKRLLLRFETNPIRSVGFKLMAFTLLNLREFCRPETCTQFVIRTP